MTTGLLLACADISLREQFLTVLAEAGHLQVVEVVTDSAGLLTGAERDDLDVVVVHDLIDPVSAAQVTQELLASRPYLPVLWLSLESDAELLGRALESGARGLLTAPLSLEGTQSRIDAAVAWSRALISHVAGDGSVGGRRGTLLALAGAKGGVGTTVLATLLAEASLGAGRSVVLVDLDVRNGSVGFYTDIGARRSIADLAEVARELTGRSVQEVVHRHPGGLSIVLAPEEVERAEDVTAASVRLILTQLRLQFSHVVVDCGSRLDDLSATVLEMADDACLVTTPDIVAVRAGRRMLNMWERLGLRRPETVKVLLNRVSKRSEVQPDLVRRILPAGIAAQIPASFASLEPSINSGLLDGKRGLVHAAVIEAAVTLGLREPAPSRRRSGSAASPAQPATGVAALLEGGSSALPDGAGPVPLDTRRSRARRRTPAPESGQVLTELPGLVFLLGLAAWTCFQLTLWGVTQIFAEHAALEVARTAAVSSSPFDLQAAAGKALPFHWGDGVTVRRVPVGDSVTVTVHTPAIMPLFGTSLDVTKTAHVQEEP